MVAPRGLIYVVQCLHFSDKSCHHGIPIRGKIVTACPFCWWLMTGVGLFWEKGTVGWWLISQANRASSHQPQMHPFVADERLWMNFRDSANLTTGQSSEISTDTVHRTLKAYVDAFIHTSEDSYSRRFSRDSVVVSRRTQRVGFYQPHLAWRCHQSSHLHTPKRKLIRVCIQQWHEQNAEIWIYNNYLLNLIYVLELRTLVLCATLCVMYSKCSKRLNVSLWCMFVRWMSCSLSFPCFVGWLGETGLTGFWNRSDRFCPGSTHFFVFCLLLVITHVISSHICFILSHTPVAPHFVEI
jgi:hypothetical protein